MQRKENIYKEKNNNERQDKRDNPRATQKINSPYRRKRKNILSEKQRVQTKNKYDGTNHHGKKPFWNEKIK